MPIIKRGNQGTNPLKRSFVERVRTGNVLPVISDDMLSEQVLRGRDRLIEGYADYIDFP